MSDLGKFMEKAEMSIVKALEEFIVGLENLNAFLDDPDAYTRNVIENAEKELAEFEERMSWQSDTGMTLESAMRNAERFLEANRNRWAEFKRERLKEFQQRLATDQEFRRQHEWTPNE